MKREQLERYQVWVYLTMILIGIVLGSAIPEAAALFEALLWPCLAALLYATFTQVSLNRLPDAFRDTRFIGIALFGNFVVVPLLVWALLLLLPQEPAVMLGVLLVLLVPCTDWFITFTHLAGGDTKRAIVLTPLSLLLQLALLPLYLWIIMGESFFEILSGGRVATVFTGLIVVPLLLAYVTRVLVGRSSSRSGILEGLGWLPVPLLAVVVFLVAGSQVETVVDSLPVLAEVLAVFVLFLVGAAGAALALVRSFNLPVAQGRTLVFAMTTRNSFVVLPFALALPDSWNLAVIVIVFQSLVELLAMAGLLWWVPKKLFPGSAVTRR